MTIKDINEYCLANPRPGDYWKEAMANTYFYVVDVISPDEIVVLKCFGDDTALSCDKGRDFIDVSRAVVVNKEWMRDEVTYSSDRTSFVADCCSGSHTVNQLVNEYHKWKTNHPKFAFAQQVHELRGTIAELQTQLKTLLDSCPHSTLKSESKFYSGGYDHVSETHHWDECVVCGKQFNKDVVRGGYQ